MNWKKRKKWEKTGKRNGGNLKFPVQLQHWNNEISNMTLKMDKVPRRRRKKAITKTSRSSP